MPKGRAIRTTMGDYFKGHEDIFGAETEALTTITEHKGLRGDNDHLRLAAFLRKYLPARYGVETGIVINSLSDQGDTTYDIYVDGKNAETCQTSRQTDIVITDRLMHAPLAAEEAFNVFPVEMVVAVIEVTRDLGEDKLEDDIRKIAIIRSLAKGAHYADEEDFGDDYKMPLPRGYVVGFSGSLTVEQAQDTIKKLKDDYRPNAILKVGTALLYRRPGEDTLLEYKNDSLFRFLVMLRYHLEKFPQRAVDLKHYLPELPKEYPIDDDELEEVSGP